MKVLSIWLVHGKPSQVLSSLPSQSLLPLLKYVRGEVLSTDHWHELFRMLRMRRGTTLEKLTFGDIVAATDDIIGNAEGLKELYR